jgi:hypothetical protein
MAITISDTEPRVQYTATAGQVSFSVPFEFFDNADLVVIKTANNADTTLNYNSSPSTALQYSVSGAGQTGGGSISLGGSGATLNDKITIYRNLAIARSTDFPTSGAFQVESLNTELDKIIAMIQQNERDLKFSPKALATTSNTYNLTFPNLEANKVLTVNSSGDGLVFSADIGSYEGNWATATGYNLRDIVKQSSGSDSTTLNNIYICNTAHTSTGSYLTQNDTSNWTLLINVADAANAVVDAEAAQTAAEAAQVAAEIAQTAAELAETNAETAETNASASATAAANSYDSFDDRYLGAKASDPTLDNDSNALIDGALYFDTTLNVMKVYDLSTTSWKRTTPTSSEQSAIDTVSGIPADVTTVAGISGNVTTVAGNNANITAVAGNASNINTVAGNNANITTVAGQNANITTLAGISADITTVASNNANITTVATDIAKIITTANDLNEATSEIEVVANAIANVDIVGTDIANVNLVGGSIANVNTVGSNIGTVNEFGERYRVSGTAPSTSLDVGDLYFDTATNTMRVYSSGGWINAGSSVNGTADRFKYTATASQTTFTGTDDNGNTLGYDAGFLDVYLNGIRLVNGSDFTASSGTSIVLTTGASASDILEVVAFGTFQLANFSITDANDVPPLGTAGQVLQVNSGATALEFGTVDLANLNASNLTSGTLDIARIADGSITNAKLITPTISSIAPDTITNASTNIVITGTNFVITPNVEIIASTGAVTLANTVTRDSATQLTINVTLPTDGTYFIRVENPDGLAVRSSTALLTVSDAPTWSTASGSLGSVASGSAVSLSVAGTSDSTVAYSETTAVLTSNTDTPNSTMNLSLNSATGAITGTAPEPTAEKVYNFTLRLTDAESQTTDRAFSITVTTGINNAGQFN